MRTVFENSPIRELDEKILEFFSFANRGIAASHEELRGKINPEIWLCNDKYIEPYVKGNTIYISMPFLDCYWCAFFYIHTRDREMWKFARSHPNEKYMDMQETPVGKHQTFAINQFNEILNSEKLGKQCTELPWDSAYANPTNTNFDDTVNEYIKEVNCLYEIGIAAILLHECAHVYYQHNNTGKTDEEIRCQEREADNLANSLLLEHIEGKNQAEKECTIATAILLDYLTMLFLCKTNARIVDKAHPMIQDRIRFVFEGFVETSSISDGDKIGLYHLCLQMFDVFLFQRNDNLLCYDNIDDIKQEFYNDLAVIDKYIE